jgi:hypothetical protein
VPVCEPDLITWGTWFETANRHVRETWLVARTTRQAVCVSTVFLGMDHQIMHGGPALLFETMVFAAPALSDICERCSTWPEAEAQHAEVCTVVRRWLDA